MVDLFRLFRVVDFSGYDYISLADQDDVWLDCKLARACKLLREDEAEGYSSNVLAFWPDGRERLIEKAFPQRRWDFLFEGPGPGCTFVSADDPLSCSVLDCSVSCHCMSSGTGVDCVLFFF